MLSLGIGLITMIIGMVIICLCSLASLIKIACDEGRDESLAVMYYICRYPYPRPLSRKRSWLDSIDFGFKISTGDN
ncbi:MAG: hypothetical protein DRJ44_06810 [Thermoprotei archaeon]|nr:MAG: hypothetical protein DRJ44_06810 [Thermoprotei archaeon]